MVLYHALCPNSTFSLYFPPKGLGRRVCFFIRMCYDGPDNDLEEMSHFMPWKSSMKHSLSHPVFRHGGILYSGQKGVGYSLKPDRLLPRGRWTALRHRHLGGVPVLEVHQREGRVVHTCAAPLEAGSQIEGRSTGPAVLI